MGPSEQEAGWAPELSSFSRTDLLPVPGLQPWTDQPIAITCDHYAILAPMLRAKISKMHFTFHMTKYKA